MHPMTRSNTKEKQETDRPRIRESGSIWFGNERRNIRDPRLMRWLTSQAEERALDAEYEIFPRKLRPLMFRMPPTC
jgi:hypothetical protein